MRPGRGRRAVLAAASAARAKPASALRPKARPTARRDQAARITAQWTKPVGMRMWVGHPQLARPGRGHALGQAREERPVVAAVRGHGEAALRSHAQALLAHAPGDPLGGDPLALGFRPSGHAPLAPAREGGADPPGAQDQPGPLRHGPGR